jgi:hypothetical protein
MKGDIKDECNRTSCSNKDARWYNHSTRKYYCSECAFLINKHNPEALSIYGHELCTIVLPADERSVATDDDSSNVDDNIIK